MHNLSFVYETQLQLAYAANFSINLSEAFV